MTAKERVAGAAISYVRSGMVVGLGTGSTADCFLKALSAAIKTGALKDIRGIATSLQSERRARELGIPLAALGACPGPDITVDGCDEVDARLDLIKGLGGALLREKVVAQNSRKLIIIADSSKRVDVLGSRSPLPIEVVPFGHETHVPFFRSLGAAPVLRHTPEGSVYITDNGNYVYDCRFSAISNPSAVENALLHRAGVVDCGLFLGMAELALIGDDGSVRELRR